MLIVVFSCWIKGVSMDRNELYEKIVEGTAQGVMQKNQLFSELHDANLIKSILQNPIHQTYLKDIRQTAEGYRAYKIAVLPWHLYKEFDTNGNRTAYEKAYFEHRGRLMTFALMTWLYRKPEDVEALEDIIWAICEEYTWSLPAHLHSKSLEPESEPMFNIDLFAAETAFGLSEILFMLEEYLSPLVVHRAKKEIMRRVLLSYLNNPERYNWEDMKNNWCAVCAGSIGAAAIYLIKDDDLLAQLTSRLIPTLDRFLDSFEADGACLEGLSYWTYGVSFYVAYADLLKRRTMGRVDLLQTEQFEKIAAFQHKCYFPGGWTVSFSDADKKDHFRSGLTSYLKSRFDRVKMPSNSSKAGYLSDPCFRWCNGIRDLLWTVEQPVEETKEIEFEVLEHAQWMLCKQYTGHHFGLAVKGGHNDEPHNHNDVGSFIFYKDGECLLTDLGSGEYTKDYFGPGRYSIFCNSSLGHSVPLINGQGQKEGRQYAAKETVFDGQNRMVMDISEAYGNKNVKKLLRDITFIEGEGIFLSDTFHVTKEIKRITERLVTYYEPIINADGVIIKGDKTACSIRYDQTILIPVINSHDHLDHTGHRVKVYSIDFDVLIGSGKVVCKLEIR